MAISEEQLFAEFRRSGNPGVLGELFDRVAPELHHVALHLVGHPADAEDVLQATCLAAIEGAARWNPERRLRPWLLGILANQARLLRKRNRKSPDPARLFERTQPEPRVVAEHAELLEELERALIRIPSDQRSVLLLRLKHGLSITEISESLARPPGTVRSQLARGLEVLRRALPAGLAGAAMLAVGRPARGLAAVRESVLAQAGTLQPVALAVSPLAGVILMKKLLLGFGLLIAGLGAFVALRWERPTPTLSPRPDTVQAASDVAPLIPAGEPPALREERTAQVESHAWFIPEWNRAPGPTPETASLRVFVTWQDTGEPVSREVVMVRSLSPLPPFPYDKISDVGPKGSSIHRIEPGLIEVRALRGTRKTLEVEAGKETRVDLERIPGPNIVGEVVNTLGQPIPGAQIWISERFDWKNGYVISRTEKDGRFSLRSIGPDHLIGVRHAIYAATPLQSTHGEGKELFLRFVMEEPGASVDVRVLSTDGSRLSSASVMIGDDNWGEVSRPDGSTLTKPAPLRLRYDRWRGTIPSVPLGQNTIRARAPGFGTATQTIDVVHGSNFVEFALEPEAEISGRVTDEGGTPIADARIESRSPSNFEASEAKSASDGSFVLRGLPAGEIELRAAHQDFGRAATTIPLQPGSSVEWNPILRVEPQIFGRVIDVTGAPLPHHGIVLRHQGEHVVRVEADAEGRFAIGELEDSTYTLLVKAPGDWRRFPVLVVSDVRPSWIPLELRVEPARDLAQLSGVVRGPRNEVLDGAVVTLWQKPDELWRRVPVSVEDGSFTIDEIPEGTCYVTATAAGYPSTRLPEQDVAAGDALDLGTLLLEEPARLTGGIIGGSDALLVHLTLELYDGNELLDEEIQRNGRRFRSQPLAAGTYQLVARGDGLRSRRIEFRIHAGEELERSVSLEAAALREVVLEPPPNADPPRWVHCRALDESGEVVWMRTLRPKQDGLRLRVSASPGSYRLTAAAGGGLFGATPLLIEDGQPPVTLRLLRDSDGD